MSEQKPICTDKDMAPTQSSNHLRYSDKYKAFGGYVQVHQRLCDEILQCVPRWWSRALPMTSPPLPSPCPTSPNESPLRSCRHRWTRTTPASVSASRPRPNTRWCNELVASMRASAERASATYSTSRPSSISPPPHTAIVTITVLRSRLSSSSLKETGEKPHSHERKDTI